MQMGMMEQVRAPSMEHGKKADLGPQVFGISGDGAQGLRGGPEQDAVELSLVLIGNRCNLFWYGKDHVEVLSVQKLGLTILEPLSPGERLAFWAMPIRAGVIRVALMAALITLLQMTAQNSSPADLDRSHDTALRFRHRSAVLQTIVCAVAAENIRYFQPRAIHFPPSLYRYRASVGFSSAPSGFGKQIERALGRAHLGIGDAQIGGRGSEAAMTQQQLDRAHVSARFQQMDGERVPQGMRCDRFCNTATSTRLVARLLYGAPADMVVDLIAREEPVAGVCPLATSRAGFGVTLEKA